MAFSGRSTKISLASTGMGRAWRRQCAASPSARRLAMALAWRALPQPEIALEIGVELGRQEAHLGEEMARALAPEGEFRGQGLVEEHHRLGRQRPVLGGAEGEDVDAGAPGDLGRAAPQEGEGIGKAGAIHMQLDAIALSRPPRWRRPRPGDSGAGFRRLGQADGRRLDVMHHALAGPRPARPRPRPRSSLPCVAGQVHQLGAAGIELRRAAFIDAIWASRWQ